MELAIRPEAKPDFDEIGEITRRAFDGRQQEPSLVAPPEIGTCVRARAVGETGP
jgi:predicted N-acetyltransferase YhbS